jgi:hypothetical protein
MTPGSATAGRVSQAGHGSGAKSFRRVTRQAEARPGQSDPLAEPGAWPGIFHTKISAVAKRIFRPPLDFVRFPSSPLLY